MTIRQPQRAISQDTTEQFMMISELTTNEILNAQSESSHLTEKYMFVKVIPDQYNINFDYSKMATYFSVVYLPVHNSTPLFWEGVPKSMGEWIKFLTILDYGLN